MPEPTNTVSAPNCIIKAASAGVAIPPAAKLGTGNFPVSETFMTKSSGAPIFLASATSCSRLSVVNLLISFITVRMCLTASTILPLPASPLVLIKAAPSAIRLNASPRFRQPQTNGTLKSCFQTWLCSSAGVRTSLSSMKSTSRASRT